MAQASIIDTAKAGGRHMRSLVAPLWKFVGHPAARRDAPSGGFLGDWQRWTRAERLTVIAVAATATAVTILSLVL